MIWNFQILIFLFRNYHISSYPGFWPCHDTWIDIFRIDSKSVINFHSFHWRGGLSLFKASFWRTVLITLPHVNSSFLSRMIIQHVHLYQLLAEKQELKKNFSAFSLSSSIIVYFASVFWATAFLNYYSQYNFFSLLSFYLLSYNWHTIKPTCLKCVIHWFLVYLQSCATVTTI